MDTNINYKIIKLKVYMRGLNKVVLIGQLGKDPDVRTLESGVVVSKFPLATSESYKDKEGNRHEQTEWHNIVLWRGLAEIAQKYLSKGNLVYIEGKLQNRSWEHEGQKKYITEIVADNLILLERKSNGDRSENPIDESIMPPSSNDLGGNTMHNLMNDENKDIDWI